MKVFIIPAQLRNYAFSADLQKVTALTNFHIIVPKQICLFLCPLKFVIVTKEGQGGVKLVDLVLECLSIQYCCFILGHLGEHGAFTFSHSYNIIAVVSQIIHLANAFVDVSIFRH